MRKIGLVILMIIAGSSLGYAVEVDLHAVSLIESSNNPLAIGDHGKALGLYQLHQGVVEDYNKSHGSQYLHQDVLNPSISHKIALWYLSQELPRLLRRFKQPITEKNIIFSYNAGISPVVKNRIPKSTRNYYDKYFKLRKL